LHGECYFSSFLLGLFNPIVTSMRSLCRLTMVPLAQKWVGTDSPISPTQFSGGQHVFQVAVLQKIMEKLLASRKGRKAMNECFGKISPASIRIVDSTIWKVMGSMTWAKWRFQHKTQNAVRLHVQLRLLDAQVATETITPGNVCERAALKEKLEPGIFYIGDRYYSQSHALLNEMIRIGCGFLFRKQIGCYDIVTENEISPEAAMDGCFIDAQVTLGGKNSTVTEVVRLVGFKRPGMAEAIYLVTTASPQELTSFEVMELYRYRWEVERFFSWLKCEIPCEHWFAQSPEGVHIQVLLCLIIALLLANDRHEKPTRGQMELLALHEMGLCDEEALAKGLLAEDLRRGHLAKHRAETLAAIKRGKALLADI
jgi:hypothetical protein